LQKKRDTKKFLSDKRGVMGLPLRLTVCLIIGSAALFFILTFILNPCIFPGKIIVNVDPMVNIIPGGKNKETFSIEIKVMDNDGKPIYNADVILKGLGDARNNKTNYNGVAKIDITPTLHSDVYEGYLDLIVKSPRKQTFSQGKMIKIVRGR